eukprot:14912285-Alexandrium_andersonii.AAC.1
MASTQQRARRRSGARATLAPTRLDGCPLAAPHNAPSNLSIRACLVPAVRKPRNRQCSLSLSTVADCRNGSRDRARGDTASKFSPAAGCRSSAAPSAL